MIAPAVIAAALIVTSVSWIRLSADAENAGVPVTEVRRKRPAAEAVPEKPAVKPAEPVAPAAPPPAPAGPTSAETPPAAASATSPELAGVFAAALNKREASALVRVRTVPPAIIFEAGKRIGAGTVEVSVEPPNKKRLTALLDGHAPQNFTLDGSRPAVTIMMKPVGKSAASFPPESGAKPGSESAKPAQTPPTAEFGDPLNDVVQ